MLKSRIAFTVLAIALFAIVALFFIEIPTHNRDLINIALGAMLGWAGSVISYYFGASHEKQRNI